MNPNGLRDETLDLREKRALGVGLIQNLVALSPADYQAQIGEVFQFSLDGTVPPPTVRIT